MCISAIMMAATALQAISAISQGNQQAEQAEWQGRQAAADAQAEREAGEVRADKIRKAGRYQQSAARAALAGGGVEVGAGTPVKIVQQIFSDAESDAIAEEQTGVNRGKRLESESAAMKMAASNARTTGYLRAGGSLLQGGAQISKGWISPFRSSKTPEDWD